MSINDLDSLHDDDDFRVDDNTGTEDNGTEEGNPSSTEGDNDNGDKPESAPGRVTNTEEEESTEDTPSEEKEEEEAITPENEDTGDGTEGLSGIEAYLSQYNIKGGLIATKDESGNTVQKHFDDLSSQEQEFVLNKLASDHRPSVEENLGLIEEEVNLLNVFRESKKPINEFISELAEKRAEEMINFQSSGETDFNTVGDDAVMIRNLKDQYPEATAEEISAELESQKQSKFYEGNVKTIREKYIQDQTIEEARIESDRNSQALAQLEEDRITIATAVDGIKDVAGWEIDNNDKNAVLSGLLEVGEFGDSKFMERIYSSPQELFKAAWLYDNAEARIDSLEKYWKKRESAAFQEGKEFATNGMPTEPISSGDDSFQGTGTSSKPDPAIRVEKGSTLAELHDEE